LSEEKPIGPVRKFLRQTRAFGPGSALRQTIRFIAIRCGLVSVEHFEIVLSLRRQEDAARQREQLEAQQKSTANALQTLNNESSARRQEQAGLRERIDYLRDSTASSIQALSDHQSARQQEETSLRAQMDALHEALADIRSTLSVLESRPSVDERFAADDELRALSRRIDETAAQIQSKVRMQSEAIGWLTEHHWSTGPLNPPIATPIPAPLVSVILPVWNRASLASEAIESVQRQIYTNWELIVVDDGSTDGSDQKVAGFLADNRIHYLRIPHSGVSAARNAGLATSRGELIAYLDSDDVWYPSFLARMVEALAGAPDRDWAYAAMLMVDESDGTHRILYLPVDRTKFLLDNVVPMTALMHRRSLYDKVGGFDEGLSRYVDWDLALRFLERSEPLMVAVMAGAYRRGSWPRITNQQSHSLAYQQVRSKHASKKPSTLRVLYALEFFPHVSETYVTTEIAAVREQGVEVVVWTEHEAPVPYETDVPILRGDLADAIAQFRPDLMHVHHLYRALRYAPIAQAAGVSMTVRGHGFEFNEESLRALSQEPVIRAVFQFPHFIAEQDFAGIDATKLRPMTCCFDPNLYFPRGTPDHHLVIRTGLASPTKHVDAFIRVAARCPRHRFVLILCWSIGYPNHLEELRALNRSLGEPVEILVNRPHAEVADLIRGAGIYLHTHGLTEPYGMPVSIAESMAVGCYIIARHSPVAAAFVAEAGKTYDTEAEAAALIQETEQWTEGQWEAARLASIERAFSRYCSPQVLQPLIDEWTTMQAFSA
jgi:glycosyltransferase involved in cell wall biosynthesis